MTASMTGSAVEQGRMWGARAADWAAQEEQEGDRYDVAIERARIGAGTRVLDVGCGSGVFLRRAADRGARVAGVDASEALAEIARRRVPEADVRIGEMEALPFDDGTFDVVTGFNSFFFASDIVTALREAGRVARPGGAVVIQVWGRAERCELTPALQAIRALRPPSDGPPPMPLSTPGVLEHLAGEAGLTAGEAFDARTAIEYRDDAELVRRLLSPGGVAPAIAAHGEEAVARAIREALAPRRRSDGSYRLENEWRYLVARA